MAKELLKDESLVWSYTQQAWFMEPVFDVPDRNIIKILLKIDLHRKELSLMGKVLQSQNRIKNISLWMICV